MTAAPILTASSHAIACAHCNAPWPLGIAQCPGCGCIAVASITARAAPPSPDDLRAQLAAVTAERDALRAAAVEHLAATDAYARAHLAPMSATADGRRRRDEAVAAAFLRAQSARRALNALLPTERPS